MFGGGALQNIRGSSPSIRVCYKKKKKKPFIFRRSYNIIVMIFARRTHCSSLITRYLKKLSSAVEFEENRVTCRAQQECGKCAFTVKYRLAGINVYLIDRMLLAIMPFSKHPYDTLMYICARVYIIILNNNIYLSIYIYYSDTLAVRCCV